jgi:hypothetical protein
VYVQPTGDAETKTFQCAKPLIGQFVFVQMVGVEGSLSLCEVEVFSVGAGKELVRMLMLLFSVLIAAHERNEREAIIIHNHNKRNEAERIPIIPVTLATDCVILTALAC